MRIPPRALYRLFPYVGRTSRWVARRFPPGGRLLLGCFVCGLLFGIDFRQTLAYQLACLAFAMLLAAVASSLYWRPSLQIRRILPERVTAHAPTRYFIEVSNLSARHERDLVLLDEVARPRIGYDEFQILRAGAEKTNWFDRAVGFPRWVELMRTARGVELDAVAIPPIPPHGKITVAVETTPLRRGWIRFVQTRVLKPDPLSLFHAQRIYRAPDQLLSLPVRYPTPPIRLRSERHFQQGGVSLAHAVGDSQEFVSLRDYRPGDPRRHIHWRSFARTGRLIVKEYQDEYFDRHALVLDTHTGATNQTAFEAMVSTAASIASASRPQDSILDIIFVGTRIVQLSTGRGLGSTGNALDYLAEAQASSVTEFDELGNLLGERAKLLASVIVVGLEPDESRIEILQGLAAQGIPCVSLGITDNGAVPRLPDRRDHHIHYHIRADHVAEDLSRVVMPA